MLIRFMLLLIWSHWTSCYQLYYNVPPYVQVRHQQQGVLMNDNGYQNYYNVMNVPHNYFNPFRSTSVGASHSCPEVSLCSAPLPLASTKIFRCTSDDSCPQNYKCCKNSCFSHNVCTPAVESLLPQKDKTLLRENIASNPSPKQETGNTNVDDDTQVKLGCHAESLCTTPISTARTRIFQCNSDTSCPQNYKCCQHSCFGHNVCRPAVNTLVQEKSKKLPNNIDTDGTSKPIHDNINTNHDTQVKLACPVESLCTTPMSPARTRIFQCNSDAFCPQNHKCCQHSCFGHNICRPAVATLVQEDGDQNSGEEENDDQEETQETNYDERNDDTEETHLDEEDENNESSEDYNYEDDNENEEPAESEEDKVSDDGAEASNNQGTGSNQDHEEDTGSDQDTANAEDNEDGEGNNTDAGEDDDEDYGDAEDGGDSGADDTDDKMYDDDDEDVENTEDNEDDENNHANAEEEAGKDHGDDEHNDEDSPGDKEDEDNEDLDVDEGNEDNEDNGKNEDNENEEGSGDNEDENSIEKNGSTEDHNDYGDNADAKDNESEEDNGNDGGNAHNEENEGDDPDEYDDNNEDKDVADNENNEENSSNEDNEANEDTDENENNEEYGGDEDNINGNNEEDQQENETDDRNEIENGGGDEDEDPKIKNENENDWGIFFKSLNTHNNKPANNKPYDNGVDFTSKHKKTQNRQNSHQYERENNETSEDNLEDADPDLQIPQINEVIDDNEVYDDYEDYYNIDYDYRRRF